MKIIILTIGKIKNLNIQKLVDEYTKIIGKYAQIEITVLKETKKITDTNKITEKDGEELLNWLNKHNLTEQAVLLDVAGKSYDSVAFSKYLVKYRDTVGKIVFVIPGAYGGSKKLKQKITNQLSLSKMTTTHELAQLFLLEQIYRGLSINAGNNYHK